jgi:protein-S-isoprenylcysteine O-methyltransferase Ste14
MAGLSSESACDTGDVQTLILTNTNHHNGFWHRKAATMAMREELKRQGNWLFRWRSFLPLALIGVLPLAMGYADPEAHPKKVSRLYELTCLLISVSGIGVRFFTIGYTPAGTSGTNTKTQIAKTLNTTGMYSIVRHPLYLGNFIVWFGLSAVFCRWWFTLIIVMAFWLYYERIVFAEEEFLRATFGGRYLKWAAKTPVFVPALQLWRSPEPAFDIRKAVKNEYKSLFALIAAFSAVNIIGGLISKDRLVLDVMWQLMFLIGLIMYSVVRFIKKRTSLLENRKPVMANPDLTKRLVYKGPGQRHPGGGSAHSASGKKGDLIGSVPTDPQPG